MLKRYFLSAAAAALLFTGLASAAEQSCTLEVNNLTCASCAYMVKLTLAELPGVKDVSFKGTMATVVYDDEKNSVEDFIQASGNLGYPARQVQ